jgi:signal transduction histidine kinase/CheY-like chemotaxis protein
MLGVEVSRERREYILWFRPEQIRMVNWAGNPDKPMSVEAGTARIHPRKSFERWKKSVTLHSTSWKPCEVTAAIELGKTLRSVLAGEEDRSRDLRHREDELVSSRDKAETASTAKSVFLANMSHEIRTPLTAIMGYAEVLYELGDISRAPQQRLDAIRAIERNSQHLLLIINDVLDISKIEAGKATIEILPCDVVQLIADIESLMRQRAESKQLPLIIQYDGPIPEFVRTDATRFRQIVVNLLGNAIKFTSQGSVRVVVRFRDGSTPTLEVEVIDSGIGISADAQAQLFQPFVQADSSTTRRFGGTGLGLAISRQLAELLGGSLILADSQPERGSTFRLSISTGDVNGVARIVPSSNSKQAPRPSELVAPKVVMTLVGVHVLVAEDGVDNQRLVRYLLERAGATVEMVDDGKQACDRILQPSSDCPPVHVILMDMQMPVMDGYAATRHLRAAGCDVPILALTAHAMADDRQKCIAAGCDDYVSKPIDRKEMIATISRYAGLSSGVMTPV